MGHLVLRCLEQLVGPAVVGGASGVMGGALGGAQTWALLGSLGTYLDTPGFSFPYPQKLAI